MQNQIADRICRTCLIVEGPLLSIYDRRTYSSASGRLADMIGELSSILPKKSDGLPETICLSCVSEINRCYAFKMKCKSSDLVLRNLLNIQTEVEPKTKADTVVDLLDEEETPQKLEASISADTPHTEADEEENPQRLEASISVDAPYTKAQGEEAKNEINNSNSVYTNAEAEAPCYVVLSSDEENYTNETKNITQNTRNPDEPFASKMPETVDKITKMNQGVSTRKRKRKQKNENLKCMLCEKDFHMDFQNLAKHLIEQHSSFEEGPTMLRVEQKQHPTEQKAYKGPMRRSGCGNISPPTNTFRCKECPRTFNKEVELFSHAWIHTSGHGFVCEICKKAYTSRAHLAIHQRIHKLK